MLDSFAKYRDEMPKALDQPGLPLHNNDSERDSGALPREEISLGQQKVKRENTFVMAFAHLSKDLQGLKLAFGGT